VAGVAIGIVAACTMLGFVAPRGHDVGSVRIAIVQGGGPQHTRFGNGDATEVFQRHVDATRQLVNEPVDVILWPENVVALDGRLANSKQLATLSNLAIEKNATIIAGVTEDLPNQPNFLNASVVINPDGTVGDRYDKVRRVPFGEYVPLRPLIEKVAGNSGIPTRDAVPGTGHGTLETEAGTFGVAISWEDFFTDRTRDAIGNGGQILMNPTNGASYWLTQVQTQQIASSRLRAIETGRWETQAAPTGLSALIDPSGNLLDRTGVTEQRVILATVPKREGDTISTMVGPWPMVVLSVAGIVLAWVMQRRSQGVESVAAASVAGAGAGDDPSDPGPSGGEPELAALDST
jgi:apolipoprotein N-acyltransferase